MRHKTRRIEMLQGTVARLYAKNQTLTQRWDKTQAENQKLRETVKSLNELLRWQHGQIRQQQTTITDLRGRLPGIFPADFPDVLQRARMGKAQCQS